MEAGNFRRTIPRARARALALIPALPGIPLPLGTLLRPSYVSPVSASHEQGRSRPSDYFEAPPSILRNRRNIRHSLLLRVTALPFSLLAIFHRLSLFCAFVALAYVLARKTRLQSVDFRSYLRKFSSPRQCRTRVTRFLLLVGQWTVLAADSFSRCPWSCARPPRVQLSLNPFRDILYVPELRSFAFFNGSKGGGNLERSLLAIWYSTSQGRCRSKRL